MGHRTRLRPAPLATGSRRPRRRTTPRSHSLMMYNEFQNQMSPNAKTTRIGKDKPNSAMLFLLEVATCDLNPMKLCQAFREPISRIPDGPGELGSRGFQAHGVGSQGCRLDRL